MNALNEVNEATMTPDEILDSACLPWVPEESGQHYQKDTEPLFDGIEEQEHEFIDGDVRHFAELIEAKDYDWTAEENGDYIEVTIKVMLKRDTLVV
jgi:hypothetical protein